ncbi:hypothetical protein NQ315_004416 [Exocentrus adspersus]|uniref:dolichol kinase n=1 Tax=Exocentrus adspersus TaxID=1586481 RepID=A0AAV8VAX4_9CUCU|nr:hypothetical protein NQ315_004416 [Exocentrus adspersus]
MLMQITTNLWLSSMNMTLTVGLLGIEVISSAIYFLNIKNSKSFYLLSCFVICIIILSLHILLNKSPILWILNLTLRDWSTVKLLIFWMFCIGIAVLIINNQTTYARKASTSIRKIFHLLTVVVYVPGLLYGCSLLYFASGVMLCIFFVLEEHLLHHFILIFNKTLWFVLNQSKRPGNGHYLELDA